MINSSDEFVITEHREPNPWATSLSKHFNIFVSINVILLS